MQISRAPECDLADGGLPRPYASLMAAGGHPEARLREGQRRVRFFESYLETFAVMELLRQADWQDQPTCPFHYRDKAAASVTSKDFAGLRHLRDKLGLRFRGGVVLYSGESTVPFGDRLFGRAVERAVVVNERDRRELPAGFVRR